MLKECSVNQARTIEQLTADIKTLTDQNEVVNNSLYDKKEELDANNADRRKNNETIRDLRDEVKSTREDLKDKDIIIKNLSYLAKSYDERYD